MIGFVIFSEYSGFFSINKTHHHEITEIFVIVSLNTHQFSSNTTGITCGAGTDDPSESHEFTPGS
jgi:hypothetical protein